MKTLQFIICFLVLLGCNEKYSGDNFLNPDQQAELLIKIVTYISAKPKDASPETIFDEKFHSYYLSQSKAYTLRYFFISTNGTRYFFVLRPAAGPNGNLRGVGGMFKIDSVGEIASFREVFNTPVANREVLEERGEELFQWMVKHGNVEPYEKNPDYVEWPNKLSVYDTIRHEWVFK